MALINGIGNVGYRPVTFTSTEPREADTQVVTVVPQPKEEKKSKHTVLKVLTAAAVVAGAVLLIRNRGKIADKIKGLIDSLKPIKPSTPPTAPVSTQAQQVQTERKTARKPRGITPVRSKPIAPQVDNKIPKIEIPDVNNNAQIKFEAKKPNAKEYEHSKNAVIREHSNLGQGEKVQPLSKTYSRKIRHNKRPIIDQTLAHEQAEFAPMFKGKKKTKIQHPVRRQAKPEQRVTAPKVETPQYKYPEAVYKYETELATKQKAADIEAAWKEYEHRKIYGE